MQKERKFHDGYPVLYEGKFNRPLSPPPELKRDEKEEILQKRGVISNKGLSLLQKSSPLDKALSSLVNSQDAVSILRDELLKERTRFKSSINDYKHFYNLGSYTISTTESATPLFNPTQGTGVSNRLTNNTRLKRATVRFRIVRVTTGPGTAAFVDPTITIVIGRTKVPPSLGAVPTVFDQDANPPVSSSALYSGLGSLTDPSLFVTNPGTVDMYHVYRKMSHKFNNNDVTYTTPASAFAIVPAAVSHYEFEIPLHELECSFVSAAQQYSVINQLWISARSDLQYTNLGFQDTLVWSFDFEFRDQQD